MDIEKNRGGYKKISTTFSRMRETCRFRAYMMMLEVWHNAVQIRIRIRLALMRRYPRAIINSIALSNRHRPGVLIRRNLSNARADFRGKMSTANWGPRIFSD